MTEAPPTRIAVFTKEELNKYGYKAITHPDGYVYFERDNEGNPPISFKSECDLVENFKTEPDEVNTESDNSRTSNPGDRGSISTCASSRLINNEYSKNEQYTQDYNPSPDSSRTTCSIDGLTLSNTTDPCNPHHQFSPSNENLKLQHADEIKNKGYSSCSLSTCNFISLSAADMVRHSSKCNGIPAFHANLCTLCNCWLISSMQRDTHAAQCQGIKFCMNSLPSYSLVSKRQHSKPKAKRKLTPPSSKKCGIIQPGLKRPVGTYLRKRSYTTLHFDIWTKKFEDDKYIPCHFKGCHFIALSVADMCQHWAYCSGDSSFAKFRCQYCSGVVTSQSLLDMHIADSHSEGEVIGREEEYPSQDDQIAESLELLCDVPFSHENLKNRKENKNVPLYSTESSIDHNYSSFMVNDDTVNRASELELIETYESTLSLKPQRNKLEFATMSTTPIILLESPNNVDKNSVIVEVSEVVKNCDLNIERDKKINGNIPYHNVTHDEVEVIPLSSNLTSFLESNPTSPVLNEPFLRETVITDGRLINCANDKTSEFSVDATEKENQLTHQLVNENDNVEILMNNTNDTLNSTIDNISINVENSSQDISLTAEPVKRKRGRPKKVIPDLSLDVKDDPISSGTLNKKRGRRKIEEDEEEEDLPRSARKRRAVARLQFSDDSGSESCESEDENYVSSASEEENYGPKRTSIKRKVGRPSKTEKSTIKIRRKSKTIEDDSETDETPIKKIDVQSVKKRGRPRKSNNLGVEDESEIEKNIESDEEEPIGISAPKKRGRPPAPQPSPRKDDVKCGKCDMVVKGRFWEKHNSITHAGLGWVMGEPPIDQRTLDSQTLLLKLRSAFKICKVGTCEICGTQKKSFLGLHSHITVCGKTSEQLQVALFTCNVCGKQMQLYSMPNHMKIHERGAALEQEESVPLPKRRSAIKAVTNFQEVLADEKKIWILYKKGGHMPEINFQFKPTGKNKVPCMREKCNQVLTNCKYALEHFVECPTVPEQYYQCLECPYFSVTEADIIQHSDNGHKEEENNDVVDDMPDYDVSTESEGEEAGADSKKSHHEVRVSKAESMHKTQFMVREKLYAREGQVLYTKAFDEEMQRSQSQKIDIEMYNTLHTYKSDWIKVKDVELKKYLPPLNSSLPVRHRLGKDVTEYQKLKIFDSLSYKDMNVGFAGGVVQNLSWCPISLKRVEEAHQLLAVSVANNLEISPSIRNNNTTSSLLQIWDCGTINEYSGKLNSLQMVLGIALDFGELWDLTWSPIDTWEDGDGDRLSRIGLMAMACHDGAVRLYSISSPEPETLKNPPIYKVHPVAVLRRDDFKIKKDDACLRLTWGAEGVLCAGYQSGLVSVWRLQELNCNHVFKQDKTFILYNSSSFIPHFHPITGIALCPSNNKILATGGADKRIKIWNLMNCLAPLRVEQASCLQRFSWMNNWPGLCYLAEENVVGIDMPPLFNFCKTPLLRTNSFINDISFSNWAFLTGVVNTTGEFYVRQNGDPFVDCKKKARIETVISKVIFTCTSEEQKKKDCNTYADVENNNLGITFTDYNFYDSLKNAEKTAEEPCYAKYTGNAIKKIAFNPNFRAFQYAALGVQCGFIRIMRLKFLQDSIDRMTF